MPPEMPTLGAPPKKSPVAGLAVAALFAGAIGGGIYWWNHRGAPAETQAAAAAPEAAAPAMPTDPAAVAVAEPGAPGAPAAAPAPAAPAAAPAPAAAAPEGIKVLSATIQGPLEKAVTDQVGQKTGTALTQVVNRTLVWWLQVPQDLLKGDTLQALYEERPNQEPLVHAVRFTSRKLGKTFEAYRFQPKAAQFPRYYAPTGEALELTLVDGPLDSWEQITSLLKDGRRHKGVDFKTPIGTPVKATFDGTIGRKTWNFRGNGNSLEVLESGGQGRTAMYLHLSEIPAGITPGKKVRKGEVIAKSGNTGHSFAPHLHYQLMRGDKVIDPFESHATTRESVPKTDQAGLDKEVARLRTLLGDVSRPGGAAFGAR